MAAVHEAGHAVVTHDRSRETICMWIDDKGLGWHKRNYEFSGLTPETCQHLIPDNLMMTYAGEAAERLIFGTAAVAACDRKFIAKLVGLLSPPSPSLPDECRWRAEAILSVRRYVLIQLARVLAQRGSLPGDEILDVLNACWQAPETSRDTHGTRIAAASLSA